MPVPQFTACRTPIETVQTRSDLATWSETKWTTSAESRNGAFAPR